MSVHTFGLIQDVLAITFMGGAVVLFLAGVAGFIVWTYKVFKE